MSVSSEFLGSNRMRDATRPSSSTPAAPARTPPRAIRGTELPSVARVARLEGDAPDHGPGVWSIAGVRSNERYVNRVEQARLAGSPPLGRPEASCAALIPIAKTDAWWALAQDERR